MSDDPRLGAGAEFDLIRELASRWGPLAAGLGDDAAIVEVPRGERMVVSTDAAVEAVHFRRDWLSLRDIGYRAVTAALSDIAAMAAAPLGVLVSFSLPRERRGDLLEIADGVGDAVQAAGTTILGGNLSRSGELSITTTVLGSAYQPLARSAARAGDLVYVTGRLGGPAAALRSLAEGRTPRSHLMRRLARPDARLREARWLATRGAVAGIDISDGLMNDAAHLAVASGVAVEIQSERVPVVEDANEQDAYGGEEYELLLAARAPLDSAAFEAAFGIPLTLIGRVTERARDGDGARLTRGGTRVAAPQGYDHFSL